MKNIGIICTDKQISIEDYNKIKEKYEFIDVTLVDNCPELIELYGTDEVVYFDDCTRERTHVLRGIMSLLQVITPLGVSKVTILSKQQNRFASLLRDTLNVQYSFDAQQQKAPSQKKNDDSYWIDL